MILPQQNLFSERPHRFTISEFHKMAEVGLLDPHARIELIDGMLIEMAPIGPAHNDIVDDLGAVLHDAFKGIAKIRIQGSIMLDEYNQREPDIAILKPKSYRNALPLPEDVFFLIEVSDSSLDDDKNNKLPMYAHSGIPEVWIVNIPSRCIEVYWHPAGKAYQKHEVFNKLNELNKLTPTQFSEIIIDLGGLFEEGDSHSTRQNF